MQNMNPTGTAVEYSLMTPIAKTDKFTEAVIPTSTMLSCIISGAVVKINITCAIMNPIRALK
jgi:hypothetical protein